MSSYALCFILGRFFAQKRVDKWVEIAYNKYATTLFSKLGNNTKFYKSVAKDIIVVGLYLLSCLQESFVTDCGRVVADLRERYILRCRSRKGAASFLYN